MSVLEILAVIAVIVGIVGSVLPALPGPPLSWLGLLLVYIAGSDGRSGAMTTTFLLVWLLVTVIVTVLDYILPSRFTSMAGGHRSASAGAMIGLFAGIFFTPVGMIGGSLLGAFIGEMMVNNDGFGPAFKAALGAFAGFIVTTGIKVIASCMMAFYVFDFII